MNVQYLGNVNFGLETMAYVPTTLKLMMCDHFPGLVGNFLSQGFNFVDYFLQTMDSCLNRASIDRKI